VDVRKKVALLLVVAALAAVAIVAVPAGAQVQGAGYFVCTVYLPIWPTTAGPPVTCGGTASGNVLIRTTAGNQYNMAARGDQFAGNAAGYSERCTGGEPLNGSASGQTVINGLQKSGGPSGSSVSNFVWTRIGVTAVVALPPGGAVFLSNGEVATQNAAGRAVAVFRPVSPATGRTCAAPGDLTAQIVGVAAWTG
jgi:hypothetical protein